MRQQAVHPECDIFLQFCPSNAGRLSKRMHISSHLFDSLEEA